MPELKEMLIEAIEHCKICKCDGCPFQGHGSYCMAVLEYLTNYKPKEEAQATPQLHPCRECKNGGINQSGIKGVWCPAHAEWHDNNWFCADGEHKEDQ